MDFAGERGLCGLWATQISPQILGRTGQEGVLGWVPSWLACGRDIPLFLLEGRVLPSARWRLLGDSSHFQDPRTSPVGYLGLTQLEGLCTRESCGVGLGADWPAPAASWQACSLSGPGFGHISLVSTVQDDKYGHRNNSKSSSTYLCLQVAKGKSSPPVWSCFALPSESLLAGRTAYPPRAAAR